MRINVIHLLSYGYGFSYSSFLYSVICTKGILLSSYLLHSPEFGLRPLKCFRNVFSLFRETLLPQWGQWLAGHSLRPRVLKSGFPSSACPLWYPSAMCAFKSKSFGFFGLCKFIHIFPCSSCHIWHRIVLGCPRLRGIIWSSWARTQLTTRSILGHVLN